MRRFLLLLPLVGAVAPLAAQVQPKPLDLANMDTTCAPCTDFFTFANGGWLRRVDIPPDQSAWGSFYELREANLDALRTLLDDVTADVARGAAGAKAAARTSGATSAPDENLRKLGTFYASCMDSTRAEREGAAPLRDDLRRIAAIDDRRELFATIGWLHTIGVGAGFRFRAVQDAKQSSRVIAEAYQGGLGLPDRDYYTKTDSASQALRARYREHVTTMFRLLGDDDRTAARAAEAVLTLETALAGASMPRVEQRDPNAIYHLTSAAQLRAATPALAWGDYFRAVGVRSPAELNVGQPAFLKTLDSLVARAPLDDWRHYLRWHLVTSYAAALDSAFVEEDFRFKEATLRGAKEIRPRWKRCLAYTDGSLGEILGQAYVRRHFTPEAKARALEMVRNIQAEFASRLERLTWMTAETKAKARAKLDAIVNKIGYPDRWRDYSRLEIEPTSFAANLRRARAFEIRRNLEKIGQPVDRSEWFMSPPTVNAYYNPRLNEIVFPAGIMQPPFFDPAADDAVNYGGMGAVIGHEITHGFDDQGRQFDAEGNLSGWWSADDERTFIERADVVRRQFDGYVAVDTFRVNGKLTLGENIADLGGLTIAYGAYIRSLGGREPPRIDGFTGPQRFFLAWAQIWRGIYRPEYAKLLVQTDPHSPPKHRTNGPLSNMPEFAEAFGCKPGDPMVRDPSERGSIW